jgi:hypothetical protein
VNGASTGMQYTPRLPCPTLRAAIPDRSIRRAAPAVVMCMNSAIAGYGSQPGDATPLRLGARPATPQPQPTGRNTPSAATCASPKLGQVPILPSLPCFVHQAVRISARADTAATRSASDMGTRTGSSIVTGTVLEPCPPRSPLAI